MPHTDPSSPSFPSAPSELASVPAAASSVNRSVPADRDDRLGVAPLPVEEDTFSRTVLALAPPDLDWVNPLASLASEQLVAALPSVLTAIDPLVAIVTHLRSPQGDWPPDLPQTPANLYPYVLDEVYEVLNAYQTLLTVPPALGETPPSNYWTIQDLAPRLLWTIAHSSPALMSLLSGITATLLTPTGEWQGGLLRLVVTLTATPTLAAADPWTVDLAVQRPPLVGVAPDLRLRLGFSLPSWHEGTVGQLLTYVLTLVEQDQPSLATWFRGVTGDWLIPGSAWRSGTLVLQCGLEFIPLPTLVAAATRGNTIALAAPTPAATPPLETPAVGVSVPLSLADLNREDPLEGDNDLEGETTIFFMEADDLEEGDLEEADDLGEDELGEGDLEAEAPQQGTQAHGNVSDSFLEGTAAPTTPENLDAIAEMIAHEMTEEMADEMTDLMPPFPATPLDETAVFPEPSSLGASSGFAVEFAPDPADEALLTVAAMFPDLPGSSTTIAEIGPIARVGWPVASPATERPALWREVLLQQHLLAQLPTWQALAQTPDHESADPDPLLLALIETACAIGADWQQPETWLFPTDLGPVQAAGCALGDLLLGLFWAVTRSSYAIAQLVGGVSAQVLAPEQGWQTGTLRLVVTLTIATEAQTWHWDLATRQGLTAIPPSLHPQAIVCVEHLAAYPMPIPAGTMHPQLMAQLRASDPRFRAWEAGLPLRWQATEQADWELGQWHLTSNLEFVATS